MLPDLLKSFVVGFGDGLRRKSEASDCACFKYSQLDEDDAHGCLGDLHFDKELLGKGIRCPRVARYRNPSECLMCTSCQNLMRSLESNPNRTRDGMREDTDSSDDSGSEYESEDEHEDKERNLWGVFWACVERFETQNTRLVAWPLTIKSRKCVHKVTEDQYFPFSSSHDENVMKEMMMVAGTQVTFYSFTSGAFDKLRIANGYKILCPYTRAI